MSSIPLRAGIRVAALLGAVVALSAATGCGSSSTTSTTKTSSPPPTGATTPSTTTSGAPPGATQIVVRHGKPVGGVHDITVKKGEPVRFTVMSDTADEVHVHGYDFHKNVAKNGSVSFDFPAKIDGGFDVELEKRGEQIAALKVQP